MGRKIIPFLIAIFGVFPLRAAWADGNSGETTDGPRNLGSVSAGFQEAEERLSRPPTFRPWDEDQPEPSECWLIDLDHREFEFGGPPARRVWGELFGGVWLGGLRGYLQTPSGGNHGSGSSHRPTIHEIGLDGAKWMPLLDARLGFGEDHELHFNSIYIDRKGNDLLDETLISNGVIFPAGSSVRSGFGLDTFRLGYRFHWLDVDLLGGRLIPEAGFGAAQLKYSLASPTATSTFDRRYNVGFYYLGFLWERPLGDRWQMEFDFAGSGGVNGVSYIDAELRAAYRLCSRERWESSLVVGWRGSWFRRHDNQKLQQNDPNVRFGALSGSPWVGLTLGVRVGF